MGKSYKALKNLTLLSQLAISLITPVIMCILLCTWIRNKFHTGDWIIVFGILFGLGSGVMSVYKYITVFLRESREAQKEYEKQFQIGGDKDS